MRNIKYQLMNEVNIGTEEEPVMHQSFSGVSMPYSEANMELAQREAYNGEITVEDDGEPSPPPTETEQLRQDVDAITAAITKGLSL